MDTTRIRSSAAFAALTRSRTRFGWTLAILMLAIYFGFILLVAYAPHLLGRPIVGSITLGFPLGLGVIIASIVLTGVYVARANGEFDRLNRQIVEEVR